MRVLAIGAHPDDIEFGCGGALLCHRSQGDEVHLLVTSDGRRGGDPMVRADEQRAAALKLGAEVVMLGLPDGTLCGLVDLVERYERVVADVGPDIVYAHLPDDRHQDHRTVHQAATVAARGVPSLLLYESPQSTVHTSGVYVEVTGVLEAKIDLLALHDSQLSRSRAVSPEAVRARATLHGLRFGVGAAELFQPMAFAWAVGADARRR